MFYLTTTIKQIDNKYQITCTTEYYNRSFCANTQTKNFDTMQEVLQWIAEFQSDIEDKNLYAQEEM